MYDLLKKVNSPQDLKKLNMAELKQLTDELRQFIIESVSHTGGHLASSLGCVELAVAIHYVFDTPSDKLIWDVGHQAYAHKILTGRRDQMNTLRQYHGISGFPKMTESIYDSFGTGHSSTSISAALGMAVAARASGDTDRKHIAVIGDGAMTAGMAFEAMNSAGDMKGLNLLVILNDNDCSISPPVGALNKHFTRLMSGKFYAQARDLGKSIVKPFPKLFELTKRAEEYSKGWVAPNSTLFEEFGLNYHGPIDGHDLESLIPVLENLKNLSGPLVLHVVTEKGHGYKPAMDDPTTYHGISPFNLSEGIKPKPHPKTYSEVFSQWICDAAEKDPKLMAITPAMKEGSGLVEFAERFPDRFFDVAIAEQHAATFAAGIAAAGFKPVLALYSTFAQRAYDQIIHDICIQKLPVLIAIDRGGIVGADGTTHHGIFDICYLRCLPDIVLMAPSDEAECVRMLQTGYELHQPAAVRYPRGKGMGVAIPKVVEPLEIGKSREMRKSGAQPGRRVAFLSFGSMLPIALKAAEWFDGTVIDMRFIKPLDQEAILKAAGDHDLLVTLEEGAKEGGAGSACLEVLADKDVRADVLVVGVPDVLVDHGDQQSLFKELGMDVDSVITKVQERLDRIQSHI